MSRTPSTVRIAACTAVLAAACAMAEVAAPSPGTAFAPERHASVDVSYAFVTEFYHPGLDQFVLTADEAEIAALSSGLIPGWQRTSGDFLAYLAPTSLFDIPVCRYYNPAPTGGGHFLTAFASECAALASAGSGWVLESSAAFYVGLPDIVTGACADGVPIFRLWKVGGSADHRYVAGKLGRDQLVDVLHWYVSEGYGPDGVAFCAPGPFDEFF